MPLGAGLKLARSGPAAVNGPQLSVSPTRYGPLKRASGSCRGFVGGLAGCKAGSASVGAGAAGCGADADPGPETRFAASRGPDFHVSRAVADCGSIKNRYIRASNAEPSSGSRVLD